MRVKLEDKEGKMRPGHFVNGVVVGVWGRWVCTTATATLTSVPVLLSHPFLNGQARLNGRFGKTIIFFCDFALFCDFVYFLRQCTYVCSLLQ